MRKFVNCCYCWLVLLIGSCGPGVSDYSEEIAEGYTFENQGEGLNIIFSSHNSIKTLFYLKKYYANDNYICAWQADSTLLRDPNFRMTDYKKNTYYKSDRFYIIDIKKERLYGPYEKGEFFEKATTFGIHVSWKPNVIN